MSASEGIQALIDRGRELTLAGRTDEAEELLGSALDGVRGTGSVEESRACGSFGTFFALTGRRYEAMLLYRRGHAIGRERGDPYLQVHHLSNLAGMYVELRNWELLSSTLTEIDRLLAGMDPADRDESFALSLWPRIYLAIEQGRPVGARSLFEQFLPEFSDRDDPTSRAIFAVVEADVLTVEGRPEAALEVIRAAEAIAGLPPEDRVYLRIQAVQALEQAGREDEALESASRALEEFQASVLESGPGEHSIEDATDLAKILGKDPARAEEARRACDLAASIVLARIAALDRCVARIPELSVLPEDDVAWVTELIKEYRAKQVELHARVSELLALEDAGAGILYAADARRKLIRICAWCERVGTPGGHWLPLAHYVPEDSGVLVTHCICPDCADREAPRIKEYFA